MAQVEFFVVASDTQITQRESFPVNIKFLTLQNLFSSLVHQLT